MKSLIVVNTFFAAAVVFFIWLPITNNWYWLALMAAWCLAEAWLSQDLSIKWWQWAGLFVVLGVVDAGILFFLAV